MLPLFAEKRFHCSTPDNTYSHTWRVNRTWVASNSTFPDVVYITWQILSNGSTQSSLLFRAYAKANKTDICCFITNGVGFLIQLDYNIVIQGIHIVHISLASPVFSCWLWLGGKKGLAQVTLSMQLIYQGSLPGKPNWQGWLMVIVSGCEAEQKNIHSMTQAACAVREYS